MIGLNNEFCSSKEEYEIARLATKCAGLQGKIDDLTALCDQLGGQLTIAMSYIPNNGFGYADCDAALEAWRAMK
jgi:hypothetical protein